MNATPKFSHKVLFAAIVFAGASFAWLAMDRDPGTEYHKRFITTHTVKAGDYVGRKIAVTRRRACSVDASSYISDVRGVRWHIDTPRRPSSGPTNKVDEYVVYVPVPNAASPGPATLTVVLEHECGNPFHRFWPIVVVQSPLHFTIVE